MARLRFRYMFFALGSLVALLMLASVDPDTGWINQLPFGSSAVMAVLSLSKFLLVLGMVHWGYKALHDYPEADGRRLFTHVLEGNMAAGIALLARAVIVYGLLALFGKAFALDVRTDIPPQAKTWQIPLKAEQMAHWRDVPMPHYLPALIEHESCLSLTHSRCWNPRSRLKSAREEGAGLGQITRAYTSDGKLRFDALAEMRRQYPALQEWSWDNVYDRPDLQLRGVVLKVKSEYQALPPSITPPIRMHFADAAYNGGRGGMQKERTACGLKQGCDPHVWFGHVEKTCLKSLKPLYGGRSACDINRHHVKDVIQVRMPKYHGWV